MHNSSIALLSLHTNNFLSGPYMELECSTVLILLCSYAAIEQEIEHNLEQASVNCDRLTILINKEPPQKKQSARM